MSAGAIPTSKGAGKLDTLGCTKGGIMCTEHSFGEMDRREFLRLGGAGLAGAVLLGTAGATGGRVLAQAGSSLVAEFEAAAQEHGVPRELLLAMGYVNTMWEMPAPEASAYREGDIHGRGAYGIMQLVQNPWEDTLGEAARLTGLSEEQLKNDRAANIRGGTAVLAGIPGSDRPTDLNGWQEAVAEYGGIDLYAVEVYETLQSGASETISTGERVELAAQEVEVPVSFTAQRRGRADYRRAVWRPAYWNGARRCENSINYCQARRGAAKIGLIVIHIAQGSYSGTIDWFQNRASGVSAHYVVGDRGKVAQCVRNADIAYHAGHWGYNKRSIGIEHAGYASNPGAFRGKYRTSAKLSAYLARRYKIPVNKDHFVLHRNVPGVNKTCPGRYFDYDKYLRLVKRYK
jgi:hypothetical protein